MSSEYLSRDQWKKYEPKPVREGSWISKQPLSEVGYEYHMNRQRIADYLGAGYDVNNLKGLSYQGPGKHSYIEHQAILTRDAIVEHNEAVDALKHIHGIDVGAPDYWDDATREGVTAAQDAQAARGGIQRERAKGYDVSRRVNWGGEPEEEDDL